MNKLRVLLVDDHVLVRTGIRMVLASIADIDNISEAENGKQALQLVETLRPDIALLDISMPGISGIQTAAHINKHFPKTRTIILSMHGAVEYVAQALQSGASGYLLKDAKPDELKLAIEVVARGDTYISPQVSDALVNRFVRSAAPAQGQLDSLTARQRGILQLIAEGKSTKQIATLLDVSIKTVETHRAQLMKRLGIQEIAGLVRFAMRVGLITDAE